MVFEEALFERSESHRWRADRVRVEDIHNVGHPRRDAKIYDRTTHSEKPDGYWDKVAERVMLNFAENHSIFRATSAIERGELRSREKGKKFAHFNGSEEIIELVLLISLRSSRSGQRTVHKFLELQENLMIMNIWRR